MSRRPRATLLVLLALLLALVPTTARAAGLSKLVDPDTSARWEEVFGTGSGTVSTENAGRIWADKSVYASADDACAAGLPVKIDVDDHSFIVGLSTLASAVSVRQEGGPAAGLRQTTSSTPSTRRSRASWRKTRAPPSPRAWP